MNSIITNISSTVALNALTKSTRAKSAALEKVSSGSRINSAADDAAGLSIASKMSSKINGLKQAVRNAHDGISMLQTASGTMENIAQLLQRIRELNLQAANDTLSADEREILNRELIASKISIASAIRTTEFNGMKILSNTELRSAIEINHSLSQTALINTNSKTVPNYQLGNLTATANLSEAGQTTQTYSTTLQKSTFEYFPTSLVTTTANDYRPAWSADGASIVFASNRSGTEKLYALPAVGGSVTEFSGSGVAPQRTTSADNLWRAFESGNSLVIQRRLTLSGSWSNAAIYSDYQRPAGETVGFSFSPTQVSGATSLVYSDNQGNIKRVNVNTTSGAVSNVGSVITTTDTFDLTNSSLSLSFTPNLVNMSASNSAFTIQKTNDTGTRTLTYWNGTGTAPADGYYTVSGNTVTFFGTARIGGEATDDAADYYTISQSPDAVAGQNFYGVTLPSSAEIYNMDGSSTGPRSLVISVGGQTISRSDLLATRPTGDANGIYVNPLTSQIEFYGSYRPSSSQSVRVTYMANDVDGVNQLATFAVSGNSDLARNIDTYNLTDPDLTLNRSLRVYIGSTEVPYSATNGFIYDRSSGRIILSGDYRPDPHTNDSIIFRFVFDSSRGNTSTEVFGIPLSSRPAIYSLDPSDNPTSLRVIRNGQSIAFDPSNGFQYNATTNTVELFGTARPNATDTYSVFYVLANTAELGNDGRVVIPLGSQPSIYDVTNDTIPDTFRVTVNGSVIAYDPTATNGFTYDAVNNRIEIFGNARPDANTPVEVNLALVNYVRPTVALPTEGTSSYEFVLNPATSGYGVAEGATPRAIRVYRDNLEVPYNSVSGFTFDPGTQKLQLHGDYRPVGGDAANRFRVTWVPDSALTLAVPAEALITTVRLNGTTIPPALDAAGPGYIIDGAEIRLVGNSRPDAALGQSFTLNANYTNGLYEFNLSSVLGVPTIPAEVRAMFPHLDERLIFESLGVKVNGAAVSSDFFSVNGSTVSVNLRGIENLNSQTQIVASFASSRPTEFADSLFSLQIGSDANQRLDISIGAFENLLIALFKGDLTSRDDTSAEIIRADLGLSQVLSQQAQAGAKQNQLESLFQNLLVSNQNLLSSRSRVLDTELARESAELIRQMVLQEAQMASLTHSNESREYILRLLETL